MEKELVQKAEKIVDERYTQLWSDYMQFKSDMYAKHQALFEDHTVLAHQVAELRDGLEELQQFCMSLCERMRD